MLSVRSIYASPDFAGERFGPTRWLENGAAYTTLEKSEQGKGKDIVRYVTESAARTVLVPATAITAPGDTAALDIEDYSWSPDGTRLLIFTNSQPVWRQNNRGDYWVLDRASGKLQKLGGPEAKPSTLLFAKFSPDGGRIGYVRENNIYVENLATGAITQVTTDGAKMLINGTFDWVYEEELDLRDGWRWSPDGQRIAYWQLNTDGVLSFDLINDTDSLYSFVTPVQYPKAGEANSAARVGVVSAAGGTTVWLPFEGDPREHYPARMEWAASSSEVVVQRLNRLQNTLELFLADASTGQLRTILTEHDNTWVAGGERPHLAQQRAELHLDQRARRLEPRVPRVAERPVGEAADARAHSTSSMSSPSTTRAAGSTTSRRPTTRRSATCGARGSTGRGRPSG